MLSGLRETSLNFEKSYDFSALAIIKNLSFVNIIQATCLHSSKRLNYKMFVLLFRAKSRFRIFANYAIFEIYCLIQNMDFQRNAITLCFKVLAFLRILKSFYFSSSAIFTLLSEIHFEIMSYSLFCPHGSETHMPLNVKIRNSANPPP